MSGPYYAITFINRAPISGGRFTLCPRAMTMVLTRAPNYVVRMTTISHWICQSACPSILREVGTKLKVFVLGPYIISCD
jgi:hypothetical protein